MLFAMHGRPWAGAEPPPTSFPEKKELDRDYGAKVHLQESMIFDWDLETVPLS